MASSKARGEREPEAYPLEYVEDSVGPRTKVGERRVLARQGWAGWMSAFSPSCYRRRAITLGVPQLVRSSVLHNRLTQGYGTSGGFEFTGRSDT
jgi:hypothetical protein